MSSRALAVFLFQVADCIVVRGSQARIQHLHHLIGHLGCRCSNASNSPRVFSNNRAWVAAHAEQALVCRSHCLDHFELTGNDHVEAVAIVAFAKEDRARRDLQRTQRGHRPNVLALQSVASDSCGSHPIAMGPDKDEERGVSTSDTFLGCWDTWLVLHNYNANAG